MPSKILLISTYRHLPSNKVFRTEVEQQNENNQDDCITSAVDNIAIQVKADIDASKHFSECAIISMLGYKACADWSKPFILILGGSITFCSTHWQFNYTVKHSIIQ